MMKKVTQEQINEIKRLWKVNNLPGQTLPTEYEKADKLIKEIKSNWGE